MADKKISELTLATTVANEDVLPIVQGGTTKKVPISVLLGAVNLTSVVTLNVSQQLTAASATITNGTVTTLSSTTANLATANITDGNVKKSTLTNFEVIDNEDTIDLTTSLTVCTNSNDIQYSASLPAGINGLIKKIVLAGGQISVTSAFGYFWTSITVSGEYGAVELIWLDTLNGWFILSLFNATASQE